MHWMMDSSAGAIVFLILATLMMLVLYFLPTLLGVGFSVEGLGKLFLTNLLIAWTVLGWFACLIWVVLRARAASFDTD